MNKLLKFLLKFTSFEIARLQINPGDIVVLRTPEQVTLEDQWLILEDVKKTFPNNTCLLLSDGASLEIIKHGGASADYCDCKNHSEVE